MDFDLFELEDDDILSSVCVIQTEETEVPSNPLPGFDCTGEDSLNAQFSNESFVRNFFIFNENNEVKDQIELTSHGFKLDAMYSKNVSSYIFGQARMNIQSLVVATKGTSTPIELSFFQRRRQVTLLLHLVYLAKSDIMWEKLKDELHSLRILKRRISSRDILKNIFMASNTKGNEADAPAYHLLHGLLEWKFLDLLILKRFFLHSEDPEKETNFFETPTFLNEYNDILKDLFILSICLFKKKRLPDLMFSSPFACTCIKESWLLMQLLIEQTNNGESFWLEFNKTIDKIRNDSESYMLSFQNISEFVVWLLKGVVRLQGFKTNGIFVGPSHSRIIENFDLLETTVETFFAMNPSEESARTFLCTLMPIILEWWNPKVTIPMILWEYFHKKLNSSFFISGSSPSKLAVVSTSGKGYLAKMKTLLQNCLPDANLSSFALFTIILGKTVERFIKLRQGNQTQKILGRIYSKFSAAKFLTLNETGIHHLIELFLSLALSADLKEIAPKLKDKLLSIPLEKISANRQIALTKGHMAMLTLFSEQCLDISEYVTKLLEQLTNIKFDLGVSKIVADGFCEIFKLSTSFDCGEYLLIDTWLPNFLSSCTAAEQDRALQALHLVFVRIQENTASMTTVVDHGGPKVIKALTAHVLPFVKQNFSNNFSTWLPLLASDFCLVTSSGDQFQKLFRFFLDANTVHKQAVPKFLLSILSSPKSDSVDPTAIIQIWLRSLVVLSANNEDVVSLTRIVCTLPDFREVCNIPIDELLSAKEPLCVFISGVGQNYETCQDFRRKCKISDKFNTYLISFDKWLIDKNEKTEVTFRFYSFIAIVIFNCASIVYTKSKISCFFHIAMTRFILPSDIQVGKAPEPKFAQIIHKVWPVIVQGIGKLNFKTDPYITKTLTDLVVKWTPHFKISNNPKIVARPFINFFTNDNDALGLYIFDKLTSVFLVMQRRQADPNACLVITIFQEVVDAIINEEDKLKTFVKGTFLTILEHLMMVDELVPSRPMLLELFRKIVNSSAFCSGGEIRNLIIEHLKVITVKHLSYFTFFYFELLTQIANIRPQLIEDIMEFLQQEIRVVEEKRGGGEDNRLRTCMDKLRGAIIAAKNRT